MPVKKLNRLIDTTPMANMHIDRLACDSVGNESIRCALLWLKFMCDVQMINGPRSIFQKEFLVVKSTLKLNWNWKINFVLSSLPLWNRIEISHLGKNTRPPSLARSHAGATPPISLNPYEMTNRIDSIITTPWMTSVQTTALIPPFWAKRKIHWSAK